MSSDDVEPHVITTIKQHPMIGEYWQSHCSCGGGVTMLYRTPEEARQAARDHQPGQRASDWDQAEQGIVVDAAVVPHNVPVTIEYEKGIGVDITSAKRWENADGSVFAFVTWEEWPCEGVAT